MCFCKSSAITSLSTLLQILTRLLPLSFPLFFLDLRTNLGDHFLLQRFDLLPRLGVDRVDLALTAGVGGRAATNEEVIVELVDAADAGFLCL